MKMVEMKKPWVQIAMDVTDVDLACEYAKMAVEIGADWIEVGTPLIYYGSVYVTGKITEIAGDIPVFVDYKAQDGVYKYFKVAAEQKGKIAVVLGVCNDGSIKEAVRAGRECGIGVVGDLFSVPNDKLLSRAVELEALGVDYLFLHLGIDEQKHGALKTATTGLQDIVSHVEIPVGVAVYDYESAEKAIKLGASWVAMGEPMLSAPDNREQLKEFIDKVHRLGESG